MMTVQFGLKTVVDNSLRNADLSPFEPSAGQLEALIKPLGPLVDDTYEVRLSAEGRGTRRQFVADVRKDKRSVGVMALPGSVFDAQVFIGGILMHLYQALPGGQDALDALGRNLGFGPLSRR